jgi:hypothetical protein
MIKTLIKKEGCIKKIMKNLRSYLTTHIFVVK